MSLSSPSLGFLYSFGTSESLKCVKGITYFICGLYLILITSNKSYLPDKNFLILKGTSEFRLKMEQL